MIFVVAVLTLALVVVAVLVAWLKEPDDHEPSS